MKLPIYHFRFLQLYSTSSLEIKRIFLLLRFFGVNYDSCGCSNSLLGSAEWWDGAGEWKGSMRIRSVTFVLASVGAFAGLSMLARADSLAELISSGGTIQQGNEVFSNFSY